MHSLLLEFTLFYLRVRKRCQCSHHHSIFSFNTSVGIKSGAGGLPIFRAVIRFIISNSVTGPHVDKFSTLNSATSFLSSLITAQTWNKNVSSYSCNYTAIVDSICILQGPWYYFPESPVIINACSLYLLQSKLPFFCLISALNSFFFICSYYFFNWK